MVSNNAPRLAKVFLATDLNNNSKYENEEFESYNILDAEGNEHQIDCDSLVFSGGRQARMDEAMGVAGAAKEYYVIGDNRKPATVKEATFTGYTAAMSL